MEAAKEIKIWDCTLFLNEFEVLELRLEEIGEVVDKFVVTEGSHTFMGTPKPLNLKDKIAEYYPKWQDKIIYLSYDVSTGKTYGDQWGRETACRDTLSVGLKGCADDDLVMIADLDNIPRARSIEEAANMFKADRNMDKEILCLEMPLYNYWINCFTGLHSHECSMLHYSLLKTITPNTALRKYTKILPNAGWSFSYLGGPERIIEKIKSYSHAPELNTPERKDREWILKEISIPRDVLGSRRELLFVPLDDSFPQTILKNMDKYKQFIKEI